MKILVNNDLSKSTKKLSKFKTLANTKSGTIKESQIFKKPTAHRRAKILAKRTVIRNFKKNQKIKTE